MSFRLLYSIYSILAVLSMAVPAISQEFHRNLNPIRFNSAGKLKIVNIADIHYGEGPNTDWGPEHDVLSTNVIRNILRWEHPDFVIFTGDQVSGEGMYRNVSAYVDMIMKPLVDGGYRWATTYGNHDVGPNVTRLEMLVAEQKYSLSYTQRGPPYLPGITNYYLPVYPPSSESEPGPNERPAMIWWFFDSQGGWDGVKQIPEVVDETVVAWFRREHQAMANAWGYVPGLAFFHIPTLEYVDVQADLPNHAECSGLQDEQVYPQDRNTGLLDALIEAGTVKTTFVGHDHGDAWCCYYRSLEVCYNRHTGYGGYGNWTRGVRVIDLDYRTLNETRINYIRLEDGSMLDWFPFGRS